MKKPVVSAARVRRILGGCCVLAALWAGDGVIRTVLAQQTTPAATQVAAPDHPTRGGIRNLSPEQTAAVSQMNQDISPLIQSLTAARKDLVTASLASPRNDALIKTDVEVLKAAETALAHARADALSKIQSSAAKLTAAQINSLATATPGRGNFQNTSRSANTGIPNMTSNQVAALTQITGTLSLPTQALTAARAKLTAAPLSDPRDDAAITSAIDTVAAAELTLASTRTDSLAQIQSSPNALSPDQLSTLIANGGILSSGNFHEPQPLDFNDHEGYVSLFDGKSLKGWDGNPKFWRVEDNAIVGESTPQNPSGNTYIAYRDITAKDFTFKCEIKIEGSGGSGIQYRSKSGIPWLTPVPANVIASAGPTNLDWMLTGPQADFWPSRDATAMYSGQFYSENTPMRIMAFRGQVVEGFGMAPRRLMGNIGDRAVLGKLIKLNDWNQYTVIARGGTFVHIINGQLMAVMIDDDPTSSNNQPGLFGIEIEATTKVSARNIWLKKLK